MRWIRRRPRRIVEFNARIHGALMITDCTSPESSFSHVLEPLGLLKTPWSPGWIDRDNVSSTVLSRAFCNQQCVCVCVLRSCERNWIARLPLAVLLRCWENFCLILFYRLLDSPNFRREKGTYTFAAISRVKKSGTKGELGAVKVETSCCKISTGVSIFFVSIL